MDHDRTPSRHGRKPETPGGRCGSTWALLAVGCVAATLVVVIALMPRGWEQDAETVAAPRRAGPTATRRAAGIVPRPRAADPGRRIDAPPAPPATPNPLAAAAPPAGAHDEVEEEVIDNAPGQEFPAGIDAADYIQQLREMGVTDGIAAFPPPGTDPPKAGVVVPDDYELPEGYERYYQYTDDGRPLDPILRFSPEYEILDTQGNPILIPDDRIVPPELVPEDLPVELLDPESPREPGGLIGQDR